MFNPIQSNSNMQSKKESVEDYVAVDGGPRIKVTRGNEGKLNARGVLGIRGPVH